MEKLDFKNKNTELLAVRRKVLETVQRDCQEQERKANKNR